MSRRKRPPARRSKQPNRASAPDDGPERLQKVLAAAGLGSRRECETLILEGRVEVDGKIETELGTKVDRRAQTIRVDGEPLPSPKLVYIATNKPKGTISTSRDPAGRPRVIDMVPPSAGRLFTVGRLDVASEGLMLLTNDGELANRLTHPRYEVQKTYLVQVAGRMDENTVRKLRKGFRLAEGFAKPVDVKIKSTHKLSTVLEMVLDEGRNREVRRLLARVGHKVHWLRRIAIGPLRLAELPPGAYRPLEPKEVRAIWDAASGPAGRSEKPARRPSSTRGNKGPAKKTTPRPRTGKVIR